jgi:hypothetical protein
MLDERTEALLIEALSTASGGETVAITRGHASTVLHSGDLCLAAYEMQVGDLPPTVEIPGDLAVLESVPASSGDLAPDDALLAVQVFDAYLTIASHIQEMPGAVAMNDETRRRIKAVREKIRGLL